MIYTYITSHKKAQVFDKVSVALKYAKEDLASARKRNRELPYKEELLTSAAKLRIFESEIIKE